MSVSVGVGVGVGMRMRVHEYRAGVQIGVEVKALTNITPSLAIWSKCGVCETSLPAAENWYNWTRVSVSEWVSACGHKCMCLRACMLA